MIWSSVSGPVSTTRASGGHSASRSSGMIEPGVQADRAAAQQSLPAHGDQVGGAGSGADEVDRHGLVTNHWVTGIAGRQPVNRPTGSPR